MLKALKKKINNEYIRSEVSRIDHGDLDMVMKNKKEIAEKFSHAGLKKYAEMAKILLGMIKDYRKGKFKMIPWFTIASAGFVLLYIFNPLDIVPDFIPGLGYLDDFAVFTIVIRFIETDLHHYLDWKLAQDNE